MKLCSAGTQSIHNLPIHDWIVLNKCQDGPLPSPTGYKQSYNSYRQGKITPVNPVTHSIFCHLLHCTPFLTCSAGGFWPHLLGEFLATSAVFSTEVLPWSSASANSSPNAPRHSCHRWFSRRVLGAACVFLGAKKIVGP